MANKGRSVKRPGPTGPVRQGQGTRGQEGTRRASSRVSSTAKANQTKPGRPNEMHRRAREQAARNRSHRLRMGFFTGVAALVLGGVIALAVLSGTSSIKDNTSTTAWVLSRFGQVGTVSLASLRGKPVVVNMFASWCTECEAELPAFASAAQQLRGKVTFVEVNSLETGNGQTMAQHFGLASAGAIVLSDVGGSQNSGLHDALGGGNNMPVSAFYSASGQLLTNHIGAFNASTLQSELQQLYGASA